MCTINKSANTKKVWKLIVCPSYIKDLVLNKPQLLTCHKSKANQSKPSQKSKFQRFTTNGKPMKIYTLNAKEIFEKIVSLFIFFFLVSTDLVSIRYLLKTSLSHRHRERKREREGRGGSQRGEVANMLIRRSLQVQIPVELLFSFSE